MTVVNIGRASPEIVRTKGAVDRAGQNLVLRDTDTRHTIPEVRQYLCCEGKQVSGDGLHVDMPGYLTTLLT